MLQKKRVIVEVIVEVSDFDKTTMFRCLEKQYKMPPNHIYEPSDAELEILQVLWEHEPATVRTVFEILEKKRDVGYTTILKQMQRMYEKGMVKRDKDGKGHVYTAVPREEEIKKTLLDDLVDKAFKGSAMDLVMHALGRADTSPEELEALKKWLEEQDED